MCKKVNSKTCSLEPPSGPLKKFFISRCSLYHLNSHTTHIFGDLKLVPNIKLFFITSKFYRICFSQADLNPMFCLYIYGCGVNMMLPHVVFFVSLFCCCFKISFCCCCCCCIFVCRILCLSRHLYWARFQRNCHVTTIPIGNALSLTLTSPTLKHKHKIIIQLTKLIKLVYFMATSLYCDND